MLDLLNDNQGVIAVISIIITIVGFFITNNNITKIKQNQKIGSNSKGVQAGKDATDNSINYKS